MISTTWARTLQTPHVKPPGRHPVDALRRDTHAHQLGRELLLLRHKNFGIDAYDSPPVATNDLKTCPRVVGGPNFEICP